MSGWTKDNGEIVTERYARARILAHLSRYWRATLPADVRRRAADEVLARGHAGETVGALCRAAERLALDLWDPGEDAEARG